jgi:hypothetical protein
MLTRLTPIEAPALVEGQETLQDAGRVFYDPGYVPPSGPVILEPVTDGTSAIPLTDPMDATTPTSSNGLETPITTVPVIKDPNITDIFRRDSDLMAEQFWAEMRKRYAEIMAMSSAQLAAAGIVLDDGSYFKNNVAYLTKNSIDYITNKYGPLMDTGGNYTYDLTIPQDIMVEVVNKYPDMPKADQEQLAREAYESVKTQYDTNQKQVVDDLVQKAVSNAEQQNVEQQTDLGKQVEQTQAKEPGWLIWALVAAIIILYLLLKGK